MKKRILAFILSAAVTVCGLSGSFGAVAASKLTMEKSQYYAGENCVVGYSDVQGSGPWWGVYWRSDTPGLPGIGSRFWKSMSAGSGTIDFANIDGGSSIKWSDIGVGEYKLCVFADESKRADGAYNVIAQVDFEVVKNTVKPQPPKSAKYQRDANVKNGFADGEIVITPPDDTSNMSGYAAFWGDNNGPFENYAPMKIDGIKDSGKTTRTYSIVDSTFIPSGATKLYVYSAASTAIKHGPADMLISASAARDDVKAGAALSGGETPLYSFQVTSDWHIHAGPENNIKVQRLGNMFQDVKENDPDSTAIIGNGDINDNSADDQSMQGISPEKSLAEYKMLKSVIEKNKSGLPPLLFAVGNHDLRGFDGYEAQLKRFQENTGTEGATGKPYYYKEIGGAKFIFLGSEHTCDNEYNYAELSPTQLKWFENTLKENAKASEPIFIFLHQPLKDTVSGSTNGNGWNGVSQDAKMRSILKKYPQAVMFTGHTHWEIESQDEIFTGYGKDFTGFNDGGVGKLYTDENKDKEGSQGLYVEVYKEKILVKGRDFENKLWVTSAQFIVDTSLPALEMAKSMSATPSAVLNNQSEIVALYNELNAMGDNKGAFAEAFEAVKSAKTALDNIDPVIKSFKAEFDTLKEQYSANQIDPALLIRLKKQFSGFSSQQKSFLDGVDTSLANIIKKEQTKNQVKLIGLALLDKNNNVYPCRLSGNVLQTDISARVDLKQMKLAPTLNKSGTLTINSKVYKDSTLIDLSGKTVKISVVSPLGDEIYNSEYTLSINVTGTAAVVKNGWVLEKGRYYLYAAGKKKANTLAKDKNGKTYCSGKNGERVTSGVYTLGKNTYAFDKSGVRITKTGFVKLKKATYFVKSGKVLKSKVFKFKNKTYAVSASGKRLSGNKVCKVNSKLYYVDKKGRVVKSKWKKYKGKWYYARSNGKLYTNTVKKIKGVKYKFLKNGICKNKK